MISRPKLTETSVSAALALATSLALALPAAAAQGADAPTFEKVSGPERIDYAGKLRMLSQRIPASACNAAAGIGGWEAKGYLSASVGEFDRIMNALEHGDVFILIRAPETDRRVLERIAQMNDVWHPVRADMVEMTDQTSKATSFEQVTYAVEAAPRLLDITQALVGDLIGEYADPAELLATDAVGLDIVGRQRMMPQIVSKTACMIAEGLDADGARQELADAMALYELSLTALRDGMPEVGVRPPPTDEIAAGLAEISARWQTVRPLLDRVEAGETLTNQERETIYSEMNHLTAMMNEVSADYAKASRKLL
ncbi:MAG: type IV pili methyl-accepting chemotaxis transducer N-terminal domain-containing protein [Pseudomonadota bacterium]